MTINQHKRIFPRLPEFQEGKLYARDLDNPNFKFITVYDLAENVLLEYANVGRYLWITPDGRELKNGGIVEELITVCRSENSIYIDLYVNDFFKNHVATTVKRVFRYHMSMTDRIRKGRGGNYHKSRVDYFYNLEAIDDVRALENLEQVIPNIAYF